MKIELVKNEEGSTVGWTITGENESEKRTLGSMRNHLYFGMGERVVEYDGMSVDPNDPDYVEKLHFATRAHIKSKKTEIRKRIIKERNGK